MKFDNKKVPNWINGKSATANNEGWLNKVNPHNGELLWVYSSSDEFDVQHAINAADNALPSWSRVPPVQRGQVLSEIVRLMKLYRAQLAKCVAVETGKPPSDAIGEVNGAILQGEYWAGEGMRLHGRSLTSGIRGKSSYTIREPIGVAGLIVPANTPMANIAWKVFPALICGNTVVLKSSEDAPNLAHVFAQITKEAGLADGVFNVINGVGSVAGSALVKSKKVAIISFTGSSEVGRWIAEVAGSRLAKVSLELGGKNPFVVCDDSDLDHAVHWAALSAFSNAGQRCSSGSRIFVFDNVYEEFKSRLINKANSLELGVDENCDVGPVISKRQHLRILKAIDASKEAGGSVLCGGGVPKAAKLKDGFYIQPTLVENVPRDSALYTEEVFGPVATIHKVSDICEAIEFANDSEYGLTASVHTCNIDRAMWFAQHVKTGVANVNLGTFGSEPHMPFGGTGASGNGTREPGAEAVDVYSELKIISILTRDMPT
ncbi:aldehyde dehydrogenase family protein [Alphaproteobacteria bacterium]|nr:aldehyde dehydrogenase family protein [Alphaproteobacteria bacterium]